MQPSEADVTALLSEMADGNDAAAEKLFSIVYEELKRLARNYMRRERSGHTLQTTALVHEAYLRLVEQESVQWQGKSHFFGIAAQMMRRILTDHARRNLRLKRGGVKETLLLDEALAFSPEHSEELLNLDQALDRLEQLDARQSKIVELRFFAGLTVEEAADFLRISPKTVKRDWAVARAWLHAELRGANANDPGRLGAR
jgi:RNA polymerase sigma-70 factor (ECF subfamily)